MRIRSRRAAASGEEALAKAATLRPHVILIDLGMPGISGLEAIFRLKSMFPQSGISALTGLDGEAQRQRALAAGADEFVSKIATGTELLPAIRRVTKRQHPREDGRPTRRGIGSGWCAPL